MSPRSFFQILIKVMGLFLLIQAFFVLMNLFYWNYPVISLSGRNFISVFTTTGAMVGSLVFYVFTVYCCFFKTDKMIDFLNLDKGIGVENIDINFDKNSLLQLAVIIIGGILIVENLPDFIRAFFISMRDIRQNDSVLQSEYVQWALMHLLKVLIGIALISNYRTISSFFRFNDK